MAPTQEDEGTIASETGVLSRHPTAFAIGGGLAAAFGSSFIPMTAIEGFVTAYGIAELLPAAAPPLGDTARLALSAGIGTLTAGALLALLPRAETEDMGFEATVKKAGSADPDAVTTDTATAKGGKLAGWLRTLRFGKSEPAPGTITDFADLNRLRIRNGDQHPDAPVRAPILASSDLIEPQAPALPIVAEANVAAPFELGEELAFEAPAMDSAAIDTGVEPVVPAPSVRFAPPTLAAHEVDDEPAFSPSPPVDVWAETDPDDRAEDPVVKDVEALETSDAAPMAVAPFAAVSDELESLSVAALIERLEAGLVRRRQAGQDAMVSASPLPEATARLFSLAKPPSLAGDISVEEQPAAADVRPLRFRLDPSGPEQVDAVFDDLTELDAADQTARSEDLWTSAVEYQPPSISGIAPHEQLTSDPVAETEADAAPEDTPAAPAQPIDDDMDAALRDALATLRQLSDRQRNS
ncbi:hypothetical protein [Sphingomonas sp. 35-24ZXX]|uniref:hypothetical protein n=1 Tax=Sphingomonas sp. 35-24ZXX TaxID=1545915 RepID=UPI00053BE2DB|nr:hypothetical protein [Sphingomonas sp. 35-24ZXX]